jgi:hypothetical protein
MLTLGKVPEYHSWAMTAIATLLLAQPNKIERAKIIDGAGSSQIFSFADQNQPISECSF